MDLIEVKRKVKNALDKLYSENPSLIVLELCERCVSNRFAMCLSEEGFGDGYFVDCEYNKTHLESEAGPKKVSSVNGNYIDIVVTTRIGRGEGDLVCFETKREKNYNGRKKDIENLEILSGRRMSKDGTYFSYDYGIYLIFGKTKERTKIEIYQKEMDLEKITYNDL